MMQFKGFKPEAMKKIQGALGFQGYAEDFDKYLEDNPDKKATMDSYNKKAVQMMNGGIVMGYANGGVAILQSGPPKMDTFEEFANRQPVSGLGRQSDEVLRPRYEKYVDFFNSGASEIPGMGLDNFGPGGRDPRTIFDPTRTSTGGLPPMDSPGLPQQGKNIAIADPRTDTSDMRDRSFQPDPRGPVSVPQGSDMSLSLIHI